MKKINKEGKDGLRNYRKKPAFKFDFWAPRRRKERDHDIGFYQANQI